jgi:replicative DNA helicase
VQHENSENVDILFAKNRSGKADSSVEMIFKKQFTRFFDVDKYL